MNTVKRKCKHVRYVYFVPTRILSNSIKNKVFQRGTMNEYPGRIIVDVAYEIESNQIGISTYWIKNILEIICTSSHLQIVLKLDS